MIVSLLCKIISLLLKTDSSFKFRSRWDQWDKASRFGGDCIHKQLCSYSSYGIELDGHSRRERENAVGLKYVHENENIVYKGKSMSD